MWLHIMGGTMKCSPWELIGISKSPLAGAKYFHKEVQTQGGPGRARELTSTLPVCTCSWV